LEDTLAGCEAILAGECDSVDDRRLYMIGAVGEAKQDRATGSGNP
jgi:F-type H+-transporting ATPase subunit beta